MPHDEDLRLGGRLGRLAERAAAVGDRARARLTRGRGGTAAWKVVVGLVGTVVLLAGVAMLALPGPGWATIVAGLAILSTEFRWAARLRHRVVAAVVRGNRRLRARPPWQRGLAWGAVLLLAGAVGTYGLLTVLGVPGWVPEGVADPLGGLPLVDP